eukprot:2118047-Alexandrium_andersonii.AAC.1
MLRSRGPREAAAFGASTYQYAPKYLVFREGGNWHWVNLDAIPGAIGQRLPPHLRLAWWRIVRGQLDGGWEAAAEVMAERNDLHATEGPLDFAPPRPLKGPAPSGSSATSRPWASPRA